MDSEIKVGDTVYFDPEHHRYMNISATLRECKAVVITKHTDRNGGYQQWYGVRCIEGEYIGEKFTIEIDRVKLADDPSKYSKEEYELRTMGYRNG